MYSLLCIKIGSQTLQVHFTRRPSTFTDMQDWVIIGDCVVPAISAENFLFLVFESLLAIEGLEIESTFIKLMFVGVFFHGKISLFT